MSQEPNILTLKELHDTLTAMLEQGEDPNQTIYFDPNTENMTEDELVDMIPVRGVSQAIVDFDVSALLKSADNENPPRFDSQRIVLTAD